jgi:acetyltransferase-like isoleucine patch superfamily enzyme
MVSILPELIRHIRTSYYKLFLRSYGKNLRLNGRVVFQNPENVEIGDNVSINEGVVISGIERIIIGNNVRISPHVCMTSSSLDLVKHYSKRGHISKRIMICDGAWLGMGCIILPGITIGEGAVVGAGAVVTYNVNPFTVVVGNPARKLRKN